MLMSKERCAAFLGSGCHFANATTENGTEAFHGSVGVRRTNALLVAGKHALQLLDGALEMQLAEALGNYDGDGEEEAHVGASVAHIKGLGAVGGDSLKLGALRLQ